MLLNAATPSSVWWFGHDQWQGGTLHGTINQFCLDGVSDATSDLHKLQHHINPATVQSRQCRFINLRANATLIICVKGKKTFWQWHCYNSLTKEHRSSKSQPIVSHDIHSWQQNHSNTTTVLRTACVCIPCNWIERHFTNICHKRTVLCN